MLNSMAAFEEQESAFAVVEFVDTDPTEVAVVPTIWITGNGNDFTCKWPNYGKRHPNQLRKAVMKKCPPQPDWEPYKINCLKTTNSYEHARDLAKRSEDTSHLSSIEPENLSKKKRKRRAPNRFMPDSVDSSDNDVFSEPSSAPLAPSFPSSSNIVEPISSSNCQNTISEITRTVDRSNTGSFRVGRVNTCISAPFQPSAYNEHGGVSASQLTTGNNGPNEEYCSPTYTELQPVNNVDRFSMSSFYNSNTAQECQSNYQDYHPMQNNVIPMNDRMQARNPLEEHFNYSSASTGSYETSFSNNTSRTRMLSHARPNNPAGPLKTLNCINNIENMQPITVNNYSGEIPSRTKADVLLLEESLKEKNAYISLVRSLSSVGGKDLVRTTNRILSLIITDDVAKEYSYRGRRNGKSSFSELQLNKAVICAVQNVIKLATVQNVEDAIKAWLKYANHRLKNKKTSSG